MIEINNLTKKYGDKVAVENLDISVPDGKIIGFIGSNGAGKTTTIKMMTGILTPTEGDVLLNGNSITKDPYHAKLQFGFVPDSPDMFLRMKGIDFLNFIGDIYHVEEETKMKKIIELSEEFKISDSLNDRIVNYSHGMRQKINIIGVLLHNPSIWILDEPMVGLDPESAYVLKKKMREHANDGNTVFFSTHVLSLAEELCDEVVILNKGKTIFKGDLSSIKEKGKSFEEAFLRMIGYDEEG